MKQRKFKNAKAITLIALVITIIILLILAGVAIASLTGSGLFANAQLSNKYTRYSSAKEEINLKLMAIQTECISENKTYDLNEIAKGMKEDEKILLEKYYPKDIGKDKTNGQEIPVTIGGIVVSVEQYDEYKFLIGESCKIEKVLEGEMTDSTSMKDDFVPIEKFERENLGKNYNTSGGSTSNAGNDSQGEPTGLISDTEYKINNETLTFTKIVTVGTDGNFSTVKEAFDYLCDNGYKTNGAIVLKEGRHDTEELYKGHSYNILPKYNEMEVSIIADVPGKTFMTSGEMGMAEINSNYAIGLKFYRIIFTETVYSDAGINGFCLNNDKMENEYHNCVFLSAVGGFNYEYNDSSIKTYNCLFVGGENTLCTAYPIKGLAENCASKDTTIEPYSGTKTTCLTNVTIDENYNITSEGWKNTGTRTNPNGSQANIGVYGGKYAWDYVEIKKEGNIIKIDTSGVYSTEIKEIRYLYGKKENTEVMNSGNKLSINNNKAQFTITENGYCTISIIGENGNIITKNIKTEGLDVTSRYQINNEVLQFKRIITVGTEGECSTVKEAFDYLYDNGYTTNVAIVLKEGTHDTQELHKGESYTILPKYNGMEISIIADVPGKTFMTSGEMGMAGINSNYAIGLKFYRIIFKTPVYSDVYDNGFHLSVDLKENEYYNCVFLPPIGGYNGKISTASIKLYNCLFVGGANTYYKKEPLTGTAENCASKDTTIEPYRGTKTTCLTNVTIDENYNITSEGWRNTGTGTNPNGSQANIGVYGGKYSW